jgi:beta-galactosidase
VGRPRSRGDLFLLNHRAETATVDARCPGVDLLSGKRVEIGQALVIDPHEVLVLRAV